MSAAKTSLKNLHSLFLLSVISLFSTANSDEIDLLLKLKTTFQNSNTKVFDSWESNKSICNFTGITCDTKGFVKEIELSSHWLTGSIPFDSICQLKSLQKLSLGHNSLHGLITQQITNCVTLTYLDLGNNFFSGSIPNLSQLSQLSSLYLNNSGFLGTFPWSSLQNMSNLIALSLGDNPFEKTPFPKQVLNLTKLNFLYLSNCSIEGKIPSEIGALTELIHLELSMNLLSGDIPVEITSLKKLTMLELYENELTGKIPVGFGNLTNLQYFDASSNHLNGDLSETRFLTQLVSLQVFENELTGEVPEEMGEFKQLVNFSIYRNKLTGTLPSKLGSWADFDFIDASENFFTGEIPPDMCKKGKMTQLLLLQNKFTGGLPESYASCMSLTRLRISNNSLSGVIPRGIWGLPNINYIDIAMNKFEGPISSDIKNAKVLAQITVANNQLSGELPSEISNASPLVSIDLSYNLFTGQIPSTIGELKQLGSLHFEHNMFSGDIPGSLGSCVSLNDINMAYNSLSGVIPNSLGALPALNSLNLSMNQFSGPIPGSLSSLRLSILDMSHNKLSGPIPDSLFIEAYNGSFAGNDGLCSQKLSKFRRCSSSSSKPVHLHAVIACFIAGLVILIVALVYFLYFKKKEEKTCDRSLKEDSWDVNSFHLLTFTEDEILDSIKQENIIGKGGSGNVYRVSLENGIELAVKHIWNSNSGGRKNIRSSAPMLSKGKQKSSEFDAEVQMLSSIRHVNVVKLYCSITSEDSSMLVYEYMTNGSLWDRLHTCRKLGLDWETRYEIAVGAAKGLEYLHHGLERPVIHRDVKSSNILLDEFLKPRIADFGLAKMVQPNTTKDSTQVIAGTHGYIAPEYGYTYRVDEKSDVYSFGVVLMELVAGKRPIEPEYGDNKDIVSWVCGQLKNKETVLSVVDSTIIEAYKEDAIKVLKIAILCTARLPALRPTMRNVVQMLEDAEPCKLVSIIVSKEGNGKKEELGGKDKV